MSDKKNKQISERVERALRKMRKVQDAHEIIDLELWFDEDDDEKLIRIIEKLFKKVH